VTLAAPVTTATYHGDPASLTGTWLVRADGIAAAEAAQQAKSVPGAPSTPPSPVVPDIARELRAALDRFDDRAAHAAIDRVFATLSIEAALSEVFIPYLRDLGVRWVEKRATVAQEHFASHLIRGRLLGLARDWEARPGPTAVLACLPGEAHDLGLLMFAILIVRHGWRVIFLGADTPFDTLEDSIRRLHPSLAVLATTDSDRFHRHVEDIRTLAAEVPVAVAGPLDEREVIAADARPLVADIAHAARTLTAVFA
jgi:MerR family transcriptional regulator, light-induced transcriptional regulator